MYLKYIQIINFKNSKSSRFEFKKGTNTIIGENDSGKTNALTAMRILLDDSYYYNSKRLKESDFSYALGNWKGHWIIISAFFDEISEIDANNEFCAELIPTSEDANFLKSYIRSKGNNYGTVTLYIRPNRAKRKELFEASGKADFDLIRSKIKLSDYEFYYTSRAQSDFTDKIVYNSIVGDLDAKKYANPVDEDSSIMGAKLNIMNVWQHISMVYIDALRDVESELHKPKNPIRQVIDSIESEISDLDIDDIKSKIKNLNEKISNIPQINDVGKNINNKLLDMIGTVYSPDIKLESRLKENFSTLSRYITLLPSNQADIDQLGLGHLNMLYMAMKLVEFEANRNRELLNIMIVEEPEAHIHTHIQKTLFDSLKITDSYTQIIMSTHSTHLSEVSDIDKINIMKMHDNISIVMNPTKNLDTFGENVLKHKGASFSTILSRYLDAKRSVLLFSKGVILVEGDGEEILIPALVKKILGVSLDEMGIGLINVGSVAFENIACIFDEDRLQRRCAIITDLDSTLSNARKCSEKAEKLGKMRQEKLNALFNNNPYVDSFYAKYTLEVDFINIEANRKVICDIIEDTYQEESAKQKYKEVIINGTDAERYDSTLTVVEYIKKGWYATLLSSKLDSSNRIPDYIINALAFAVKDIVSPELLYKIVCYSRDKYKDTSEFDEIKKECPDENIYTIDQKTSLIKAFIEKFPQDSSSILINRVGLADVR